MGTLYLVRHGQASFAAADYDQLSALGLRQSVRLGEHWRAHGMQFEAVLSGTLRRHAQTWDGLAQGLGCKTQALQWPGLNEYDSAALIAALNAPPPQDATTAEGFRQHFRLLRDALRLWMDGVLTPPGMPSYIDFAAGVKSALDHVRTHYQGKVLLVSSGGPIATAVGQVLGSTSETTIELNLRIRNTAVTELDYNSRRDSLVSFNALPHLAQPELRDWVTHV